VGGKVTRERIVELNNDPKSRLTQSEFEEGWHFCDEFDGLLVGPGMSALHCCTCLCARHVPRPPMGPMDTTAVF